MSRMSRLRTILILAGVLLVAAAIAGVAQPHLGRSATSASGTVITVTGNGTVDATPDRASFDFGVTTQGATAGAALDTNASQARAIIDALKKPGVELGRGHGRGRPGRWARGRRSPGRREQRRRPEPRHGREVLPLRRCAEEGDRRCQAESPGNRGRRWTHARLTGEGRGRRELG